MADISSTFELREKIPNFLEKCKSKKILGFFHYSLSGDLYDESIKWGLGNTVFTAKFVTLWLIRQFTKRRKASNDKFYKKLPKGRQCYL